MVSKSPFSSLVYSTDSGRLCPGCQQPIKACICKSQKPLPTGDGIVRVGRETKGRGGKAVTVVKGLHLNEADLQALAKQLKAACGSGGTVKAGVIEVQGDHCDKVVAWLQGKGYTTRRSGG
jgi:translation initiation factor 1